MSETGVEAVNSCRMAEPWWEASKSVLTIYRVNISAAVAQQTSIKIHINRYDTVSISKIRYQKVNRAGKVLAVERVLVVAGCLPPGRGNQACIDVLAGVLSHCGAADSPWAAAPLRDSIQGSIHLPSRADRTNRASSILQKIKL